MMAAWGRMRAGCGGDACRVHGIKNKHIAAHPRNAQLVACGWKSATLDSSVESTEKSSRSPPCEISQRSRRDHAEM